MTKTKETKEEEKSDEYQSGGAYRAILKLFHDDWADKQYEKHCRKFFKGDNDDTGSKR